MSLLTLVRPRTVNRPPAKNPAPKTAARPKQRPARDQGQGESVHRSLMSTSEGVYAWFELGAQRWAFTSDTHHERVREDVQHAYADLAPRRIHTRVLDVPEDYLGWAARLDNASPRHLADQPDVETWTDLLQSTQVIKRDIGASTSTTYLGVRLSPKAASVSVLRRVYDEPDTRSGTVKRLRAALTDVSAIVAGQGMNGAPLSGRGLGYLLHASRAIGIPISSVAFAGIGDTWEAADLDGIRGAAHVTSSVYSPYVTVKALRDGRTFTTYATTLTFGPMRPRDTEDLNLDPFIAFARTLPWPVQASAIQDLIPGEDLAEGARLRRLTAVNQEEHYAEFGESVPRGVELQVAAAKRVQDEVSTAPPEVATRSHGQWRLIIAAPTVEELARRVKGTRSAYAKQQKITLQETHGQSALYEEFSPGAGRAPMGGHEREMNVVYAAMAMPNVCGSLGDGHGAFLGQVVGLSRESVHFDPTWGPQHDRSGLIVVGGGLGSGKSTQIGVMAEVTVMRGYRTVANDAGGELARMCDMPHLRRVSRHIDLSSARPGILNTYHLVPDPKAEDYPGDLYEEAVNEARLERMDLTIDVMLDCLEPRERHNDGVVATIETAVRSVDPDYHQNTRNVIAALHAMGNDLARRLALQLENAAEMKGGRLIFPRPMDDERHESTVPLDSAVLTVLSMGNLPTLTPGVEARNRAERMVSTLTHLSTRYATRAMYEDKLPKFIASDETGQSGGKTGAFSQFFTRGALISRKRNAGFLLAGQNPEHFTTISAQITNLAGAIIMGAMGEADAARAAIRLMDLPEGMGYERTLLNFPTMRPPKGAVDANGNPVRAVRQFLMRDWHGRVGVYEAMLDHRPVLKETLDTTPPPEFDTLVETGDRFDNLPEIA